MALTVPLLFAGLMRMHGVDADAFIRELASIGENGHMTRNYRGGIQRAIVDAIPDEFPSYKGVVVGDQLRIESMRITDDVVFEARARIARLAVPDDDGLPDTVLAALAGRPLARLLGHPCITEEMGIASIKRVIVGGKKLISIELDMPRITLTGTSTDPHVRQVPDVAIMLASTHDMQTSSVQVAKAVRMDPEDARQWEAVIDPEQNTVVGVEVVVRDGEWMRCDVRFAYRPDLVRAIGKGGFQATFDSRRHLWSVPPITRSLEGLLAFLDEAADIVHLSRPEHPPTLHFRKTKP